MGDALAPTLTAPRVVAALDGGANHQCLVFTTGDVACLGERSRLGLLRTTDLGYYPSELGANMPVVPLW
jgi:hypothetical protein